ncbi:hypothetical protein RhiirA4_458143 [Rhizophagus irregularis]|uniref:Protein kinase domain-containing protein n=1 Tax=Rhizophagus irregularis TaxID=588596 RepID=A0A2I1GBK1_9GLOM|nr:hypothetical protein RhiirA4_458143 [Rhizophagus irregularis]
MDPKILNDHSYDLTKKSDIYSLAALFWQLTSCRPPFEFETDIGLEIRIINGTHISKPWSKSYLSHVICHRDRSNLGRAISNTNDEYVKLYQRCWEFEPDDRPDISE